MGDVELAPRPVLDFLRGRSFEEQRQRFLEVAVNFGHAIPLAGNIHLGTKRDIAVAVAFDNRGQRLRTRARSCLRRRLGSANRRESDFLTEALDGHKEFHYHHCHK